MTAPAFVSATASGSIGATSNALSAPASIVSGNLLVAVIYAFGTGTISAPSGWTQAAQTSFASPAGNMAVFTKTATGSEPSTYTFSGPAFVSGFVAQVSDTAGLDGSASITQDTTSTASQSASSQTPSQTDDLLLAAFATPNGAVTWTTPTGMTAESNFHGGSSTAGALFAEGLSSTSATGSIDSTASAAGGYMSVSLLLSPVGGTSPISDSETGVGATTEAIAASLSDTESGSGADTGSTLVPIADPDSGTSATSEGLTLGGAETASGADTESLTTGSTTPSSSETGTGAEAESVSTLGTTTPSSSETGIGVESQSVSISGGGPAAITADIRDRAGNLLVALPDSFNRQWQELLDQPGSGQLTVQADDPAVPSIPYRSIMRFSLGGVAVFAALVERKTTQNLAPGEEVDQTVMVQGRGTLAVFEEAAIWPEGGVGRVPFADTRNFDFTSGDLITAGWTAATSEGTQGSGGLPWSGKPAGWPDPGAEWIWAGTVTPNSVVYLRKSFAVGGAGGTVRFFFTADNVATVGLDGVLIGTSGANSWQAAYTVDAVVDGSTHHVSMQAQNTGGVAGALFAAYLINADGSLGSLVFRSDLSWIALANPATTPGFTPGAIVRLLTQEAQARGALAHVALGFTDASDSHGHAWPVIETSFPTGLDLMSALQQLSEYGCDWRMDPTSLTLRGYAPGSLGHASGVAFTAGGNLSALTHDGQA